MNDNPHFGVLLARLAGHRQLSVSALADIADVRAPELWRVLDGDLPSPALLRRLAPALDVHAADLFALAAVALPDDLAPLDPRAHVWIPVIANLAMSMPAERRQLLRQLVESLPREARTQPVRAPKGYEHYDGGFGAALVRMLHARNLDWLGGAEAMLAVANVPLSAVTVGAIGHDREELTPELLTAFAHVLGISSKLLSALTGIEVPDDVPVDGSPEAEVADLIWTMRNLTLDQVQQVYHQAKHDKDHDNG